MMSSGEKLFGFPTVVVLPILLTICSAPRAIPSIETATPCGQRPETSLSFYPWIVKLEHTSGIVECVGVLIPRSDLPTATDLILTSAPCVLKISAAEQYSYVAVFEDGTAFEVLRRDYVIGALGFVKLPQPIPYNGGRQPLCLPEHAQVADAPSGLTFQKLITELQYANPHNVPTAPIEWNIMSVITTRNELCQAPQFGPNGHPFIAPIPQSICVAKNGRFEGIGAPYYAYDRSLGKFTLWGIYNRESMTPGKHIYFRVADHVQSILEFIENPPGAVQQN